MKTRNLITTILFILVTSFLHAQAWIQFGGTIKGDAAWDKSGYLVSLSGDGTTVAVAAIENDENGFNAGQVKVFKINNGNWIQIGNDLSGVANEQFGRSLDLNFDGSILAVGSPNYLNIGHTVSGHVKVFKNENGNWNQVGDDINGNSLEEFACSLALNSDGSIIAIGADDPNYLHSGGFARVYKNILGTWTKLGNDLGGHDGIGVTVSLNSKGDIVALGGFDNSGGKGVVETLEYNNDTELWEIIGDKIDGEYTADLFGYSISLNAKGNIVAIGAPFGGDNGASDDIGQTRIFKNINNTWTQIGNDINGEYHKNSGRSVSLSEDGTIVAISSPVSDGLQKEKDHVSIYQYKDENWVQLGETINELQTYSWFGWSVSLSADGSKVAIGAFGSDINGEHSGQTSVYTYNGSLGIENLSKTSISVYPNPTQGQLLIKSDTPIFQLEIYNPLGQLLLIKKNKKFIDISMLNQGFYFLKIQDFDGNFLSKKIIKQ